MSVARDQVAGRYDVELSVVLELRAEGPEDESGRDGGQKESFP